MDKMHIELINIEDPSKGFSGFVRASGRFELAKKIAEKQYFHLDMLNGNSLLVTPKVMEKYTVVVLSDKYSKEAQERHNYGG